MNNITFIRAGAGSGKTHRVTELVAEALEEKRIQPDGLIATTFTKKAANELRERLQARLYAAGKATEAERLNESLVGTVHSVAMQLLQRFAFEAGISPRLEVLAEDEAARLLAQAVDTVSNFEEFVALQNLGDRLMQREDLTNRHVWPDQVKAIVEAARANHIQPDQFPAFAQRSCDEFLPIFGPVTTDDLDALIVREINQTEGPLEALPNPADLTSSFLGQMRKVRKGIQDRRTVWKEWLVLFDPKKAPGKLDGATKLTVDLSSLAARVLEHPRLQQDVREYICGVFGLAQRSMETFRKLKEERGLVDFADLEALAYTLLRENESVRSQLKGTLGLLVVDEFQDTSPLQLALFLELAGCAREVIWVGDVKQSIYGFRNSDPALVDATVAHLEKTGGLGETLKTNYRSTPELVNLANTLFAAPFKISLGLPREAVALDADREPLTDTTPAIEVFHLGKGEEKGKFTNENIAKALAQGIASLLQGKKPLTIFDPKTKAERPVRPEDIAVLARTNDHGKELVQALACRGIAASLAGSGLLGTPEAMLSLACLRRLADPRDRLATAEIIALKGDAASETWLANRLRFLAAKKKDAPDNWGLADTTRDARVAALDASEQRLDWLSVTEALDLALELGEVFKTVTGWGPDHARASQRRANVEMLRGMARHYEEITAADHAPATIGGFLNWCAAQAEAEEDNKAWASGSAAVQVLTYHKAKGLEWPVVVCWDLDGEPRERWFSVRVLGNETSPLSLERPLAERRIALWANPFGPKSARNPLLDKLKASAAGQQEIRHSRNEDLRLLYVGITRARDRLVLVQLADKPDADKKEVKEKWLDVLRHRLPPPGNTEWSLDGGAKFAVNSRLLTTPSELPVPERTQCAWFSDPIAPTPRLPARVLPHGEEPIPSAKVGQIIAFAERLEVLGKPDDAVLGDALHAILAAELQHPGHAGLVDLARNTLCSFGLGDAVKAEAAAEVARRFRSELQTRFQPSSMLVECPFHYHRPNGQLVTGFMDLLMETKAGWIVIDHKTFPGGRAEWPARALAHSGQLAAYAAALTALGRRFAGSWIHFVTTGGLVEVL